MSSRGATPGMIRAALHEEGVSREDAEEIVNEALGIESRRQRFKGLGQSTLGAAVVTIGILFLVRASMLGEVRIGSGWLAWMAFGAVNLVLGRIRMFTGVDSA